MKLEDGGLLPRFEPPVARDQGVMFVDQAVAYPPVVELAGGDAEPADEALRRDLGALGPVPDEVDDGVSGVVGNPDSVQSSPRSFFCLICFSINSATTSFLRRSLSRSAAMVRWRWPSGVAFFRSKAAGGTDLGFGSAFNRRNGSAPDPCSQRGDQIVWLFVLFSRRRSQERQRARSLFATR